MRIGKRLAAVGSLAIAGVFGAVALAPANNVQTIDGQITGTNKVRVHTNTVNANPALLPAPAKRAQIRFDDGIAFSNAGVPQCDEADIQGNTQAAKQKCGSAQVGHGTAAVQVAPGVDPIAVDVTAFNGVPVGQDQVDKAKKKLKKCNKKSGKKKKKCKKKAKKKVKEAEANTKLVILLHTFNDSTGAKILVGTLNPYNVPPYGSELDVSVPPLPGNLPLNDFETIVQKGNYVSAHCTGGSYQFQGKFTFGPPPATGNSSGPKTANDSDPC